MFATLPPECGPVQSATVQLVSGVDSKLPGSIVPAGSDIRVSSSGELALIPKQERVWMMRLEGVVIPMRSDWGWSFVLILTVGGGLYTGGGVLLASRSRGSAPVLRSHPHWAQWHQLRSLSADGAAYARARVSGRTTGTGGPQQRLLHADASMGKNHSRKKEKQHKSKIEGEKPAAKRESSGTTRVGVSDGDIAAVAGSNSQGGGRWVHVPNTC